MSGYRLKEAVSGREESLIRLVYFELNCDSCNFTVSSQDYPVDVSDSWQVARKKEIMQNIALGHNRFIHRGLATIYITPFYTWINRYV